MRHATSRFTALATLCVIGALAEVAAGPQTEQTNYVLPCFPPDPNVSTVGITRGVRSVDELESAAGSTTPAKRRTYELDREGRLLGWSLHPLKGGRQEWAKLTWERGRLITFDAGSFDDALKYQYTQRTRYDYDGTKLAKVNRYRSARRNLDAPVEPADWQLHDVALARQEQMPNGNVACLKVPVGDAPAALLDIVGQDGLYRQQVALPLQVRTKSEELAGRELARLIKDGAFKHDFPADNRSGWITLLDGQNPVRAYSSVELTPKADYTKFDGDGQISEAGVLRNQDEVGPQRRFEYRFDRRGNWTEATELAFKDLGGGHEWVPVKTYKRSIRYYD